MINKIFKTMAKKGERITNSRTGQIMIFLKTGEDTNGELIRN